MKPMVLLKDIPEIRVKAFGDEEGNVHFVADELLETEWNTFKGQLDMTGAGVIHVKNGISVRIPIVPPVTFRPADEPAKYADFRYIDVPLQQYGGYREPHLFAGFYKDAGHTVWIVGD